MLESITLKDLTCNPSRDGVAWSATVLVDNTPKYRVENAGDGSSCRFSPLDGNYFAMRVFLEEAALASEKAIGRPCWGEGFQHLLSCLNDKGMTAQDAVAIWKAARS